MKEKIFIALFYAILIIIALYCEKARALNYNSYIRTSLIYTQLSNSKPLNQYEQIKGLELAGVNFGQTFYFDNNYVLQIGTNRLWNREQKRQLIINNKQILNESKITSDYIIISKRYNNHIPGIIISNSKLRSKSYYKTNLVDNSTKHSILFGINYAKFMSDHVSWSASYIFGNNEFGFDYIIITGLNFNF